MVDGRLICGELAQYAGERHLRDIVDGKSRGIFWRPEFKATNDTGPLAFMPALFQITAGPKVGEPFEPLLWHVFFTGSMFGWVLDNGRLRFRSGWAETGKGQAKSPLFGAIGVYMMGFHGTPRSEVYAIGKDKATANVLFRDAVSMCRANIPGTVEGETDSLVSRKVVVIRGEGDNAWKIEHPETESKFQALANTDVVAGPRATVVLADEIHLFKSVSILEDWQRAIGKQDGDAFMLFGTNTPASTQIVGNDLSQYYQRVIKGEIKNDSAFGYIARVDKKDHAKIFDNEKCWIKALPALNVTFDIKGVRDEVTTARQRPSTAMSVKRLYFGIPIGVAGFWMKEEPWMAAQAPVNPDDHKRDKCWLSLDLSKKNDLTALSAAWEREADSDFDGKDHLYVKTWYWTTKDGLADRATADIAPYEAWAEDPAVDFTAVPGATIDKTFVAAQVARICAEHTVQFLAFDPAGMLDFMAACEQIGLAVWLYEGPDKPEGNGLKLVRHSQGRLRIFEGKQLTMPTSIERLEDAILEGSITIDDSPVTNMCAANAVVPPDGQENRWFDKARSRGRIDGLLTTTMATGAARMNAQAAPPDISDFLKNGLMVSG
jgi:phage terminase large subunit-like protein